ncbi:MAG TPA: YciI family protein [Acidimicrobiales bacterium]
MRYLTLVHRSDDREPPALTEAIQAFLSEVAAAGVLIDGGTLAGPEGSQVVRFARGEVLPTDGPFTEARDVAGGFSMLECSSDEEAVAVIRRFMDLHAVHWPEVEITVEVRPIVADTDVEGLAALADGRAGR